MIRKFEFEKTEIEGLMLIHPFVASDDRGVFMKTYESGVFKENGIDLGNAEDIVSVSKKGVIRGLHFQTRHSQDKLVRVLKGEVWDVAVDMRRESETYLKWKGVILSDENMLGMYIPKGFAHGFIALQENTVFSYRCGDKYDPESDTGIRWDDKTIGVEWPTESVDEVIVSEKDWKLQTYREFIGQFNGFE